MPYLTSVAFMPFSACKSFYQSLPNLSFLFLLFFLQSQREEGTTFKFYFLLHCYIYPLLIAKAVTTKEEVPLIDLFNASIVPQGFNALLLGATSKGGNNTYAYAHICGGPSFSPAKPS